MGKSINQTVSTGDLVKVTRKDSSTFTCIVVENLVGGFTSKVLEKDKNVGTAVWKRYSENQKDIRFQPYSDCFNIQVLATPEITTKEIKSQINEENSSNEVKYYTTKVNDDLSVTLCLCEDFGGWSFHKPGDSLTPLKESYFRSAANRLSQLSE